jgi:hypothetical protein
MKARQLIEDYKTSRIRFINQGHPEAEVDDTLNRFRYLRDRRLLPPSQNDVDRHRDFQALQDLVQSARLPKSGGSYRVVASTPEAYVVQPLNTQAAIDFGRDTAWCISRDDRKNRFAQYAQTKTMFIAINRRTFKKAVLLINDNGSVEFWSQENKEINDWQFYTRVRWDYDLEELMRYKLSPEERKALQPEGPPEGEVIPSGLCATAESILDLLEDELSARPVRGTRELYPVEQIGPLDWKFKTGQEQYVLHGEENQDGLNFGFGRASRRMFGPSPAGPSEVFRIYATVLNVIADTVRQLRPPVVVLHNEDMRRAHIVERFLGLFPADYELLQKGRVMLLYRQDMPEARKKAEEAMARLWKPESLAPSALEVLLEVLTGASHEEVNEILGILRRARSWKEANTALADYRIMFDPEHIWAKSGARAGFDPEHNITWLNPSSFWPGRNWRVEIEHELMHREQMRRAWERGADMTKIARSHERYFFDKQDRLRHDRYTRHPMEMQALARNAITAARNDRQDPVKLLRNGTLAAYAPMYVGDRPRFGKYAWQILKAEGDIKECLFETARELIETL